MELQYCATVNIVATAFINVCEQDYTVWTHQLRARLFPEERDDKKKKETWISTECDQKLRHFFYIFTVNCITKYSQAKGTYIDVLKKEAAILCALAGRH